MPAENVFSVPDYIDIPSMEVDQELDNAPLESSASKLRLVADANDDCIKNRIFLNYDDESGTILSSLEEVDYSSTDGLFFFCWERQFFSKP